MNTFDKARDAAREQPSTDNSRVRVTAVADGRHRRILLADDSTDNLYLLGSYLKRLDVEVDEAQDGSQALAKFVAGQYDLVLMDVHMPVMDGLTAIRKIREIEARKTIKPTPIVALTASVFGDDIDACIAAGADMYVAKPIKKNALLQVLNSLLERVSTAPSAT